MIIFVRDQENLVGSLDEGGDDLAQAVALAAAEGEKGGNDEVCVAAFAAAEGLGDGNVKIKGY